MAISESSGEVSVSFRGPRLTAKDWITLGTPLGNVVATCTLFVRLTEGLRRTVELFSSSILPEAVERSEGGEEAAVLEKRSQKSSGPGEFLFLESVVSSPISKVGREDWLKTEVAT